MTILIKKELQTQFSEENCSLKYNLQLLSTSLSSTVHFFQRYKSNSCNKKYKELKMTIVEKNLATELSIKILSTSIS